MIQIKLLGTRFTVYSGSYADYLESFKTSGYTYANAVVSGKDNLSSFLCNRRSLPSAVRNAQSDAAVMWIKRETKINPGTFEPITERENKILLVVCRTLVDEICSDQNSGKCSKYLAPVEAIIGNLSDKALKEIFYKSTKTLRDVRGYLTSSLSKQNLPISAETNKVISSTNVRYNQYSITNLVEDLVRDQASLIMDDNIYKYNWQGRSTTGFGNIKPIIESGELYPVFRISGVQGNQARANLSFKFDFKVNYDTGSSIKLLEIPRSLLLIQDGLRFQDMIAVRTSKTLKRKYKRLGLIDAELPRQSDYIINLKTLRNSSRSKQYNRPLYVLSEKACRWQILKAEREAIGRLVSWTAEENTRKVEKQEASTLYYSINKQSRQNAQYARKLYHVTLKTNVPKDLGRNLSQDQLRKALKEIDREISKIHVELTSQVYEYLCSNKTWREFFGDRRKTKYTSLVRPGFFGNMYNCIFTTV